MLRMVKYAIKTWHCIFTKNLRTLDPHPSTVLIFWGVGAFPSRKLNFGFRSFYSPPWSDPTVWEKGRGARKGCRHWEGNRGRARRGRGWELFCRSRPGGPCIRTTCCAPVLLIRNRCYERCETWQKSRSDWKSCQENSKSSKGASEDAREASVRRR